MRRYVLGFCFNPDLSRVVLILKSRSVVPGHVGRLNGVGGRVEPGEEPAEAMAREFGEESGFRLPVEWVEFARLSGEGHVVHVFRAVAGVLSALHHETEEGVAGVHELRLLSAPPDSYWAQAPDLAWLLPMALGHLRGRGPGSYDIWQGSGERAPGAGDPGPGTADPGPSEGIPPRLSPITAQTTTLPSHHCGPHLRTGFSRAELQAREAEVAGTGRVGVVAGAGGRVLGTCEIVGAEWPAPREPERWGPGDEVLVRLGHALREDPTMRVTIGPGRMETRAIPVEVESCLAERGRPRAVRYAGATILPEAIGKALDDVQRASRPRSERADTSRRKP